MLDPKAASFLSSHDKGFGGVNTRKHHVGAIVVERLGFFSWVKCDAGDIEPETNPGHGELQVAGLLAAIILPAVAGAQVSRIHITTGFKIDERPPTFVSGCGLVQ